MTDQAERTASPANRFGLDYAAEALRLGDPPTPIIDCHSHINGARAARVYARARRNFGVTLTYSMTQISEADAVKDALGDSLRFIAVPNYMDEDRFRAHTTGFIENIDEWYARGSRIVKFWCGPRGRDFAKQTGDHLLMTLDHPWRRKQMDHAASLGMMFMAHIADPDTWFATAYADSSFYGTKLDQYEALPRLVEEYNRPWLIAHMGGWPEDLDFLDRLLSDSPLLHLDTSATKWMVRELSKHPREEFLAFLTKWSGRILFGSDIVTTDLHLTGDDDDLGRGAQAASEDEAYDVYASRYYALRTLFETDHEGESPIADPDLAKIDPASHDEMSAPPLLGKSIPRELLRVIYRGAAESLLETWHNQHA